MEAVVHCVLLFSYYIYIYILHSKNIYRRLPLAVLQWFSPLWSWSVCRRSRPKVTQFKS